MKRCPKCSFLYLDSDLFCDLDQTPLVTEDVNTDLEGIEHPEQKLEKLSLTAPVHQRRLNPKTVLAATIASLVIGLMVLLSYQRIRPTLQASQASPTSQPQPAQAVRVAQVAHQVLQETAAKAHFPQQQSKTLHEPANNTSALVKPPTSTTGKMTPSPSPASARLRVSSNPVSTGNVSETDRGPVTIRLANGATVQADEVWRTKAGIWYRRKGIVTFLKPNRVRALNHSSPK